MDPAPTQDVVVLSFDVIERPSTVQG